MKIFYILYFVEYSKSHRNTNIMGVFDDNKLAIKYIYEKAKKLNQELEVSVKEIEYSVILKEDIEDLSKAAYYEIIEVEMNEKIWE